jgi:site-specific DNA-methyltransferase (cytosine-N4-specific)
MAVPTTPIEFTETNAELDYATHGYFRYFGKLPPVVTRFAIEQGLEDAPDGAVLDLMCGSGTTLVEGMLMGLDSVGVDVNPLSVLVSRVKTTLLPIKLLKQQLEDLHMPIRRDVSALRGQRTLFDDRDVCPDLSYVDAEQPCFPNKDYWFSESIARQLAVIKHYVWAVSEDPLRAFFQVAFLSIVRRVSNASPRIGRLFHVDTPRTLDVAATFFARCEQMMDRMQEFTEMKPGGKAIAMVADARRTGLEPESFSFVLLHPPYYALYKYSSDVLRFELEWGGFNRSDISKQEIRDGFKTTDIGTFEHYVKDLGDVLKEGYRLLKPDGLLCVVVSNSTLRDVRLPVVDRLSEEARAIGFTVDCCYLRGVKYASASYHRSARDDKKTEQDYLLFLRK